MPQLQGFSAGVFVDDVELEQHNVSFSKDGKVATCWIASEAGKAFSVKWTDLQGKFPTSGKVDVDGIRCGTKNNDPKTDTNTSCKSDVRISRTSVKPLMFSPLELTDDDSYLDSSVPRDMGDIVLEIWKAAIIIQARSSSSSHYYTKYTKFPTELKVHEKSKKALSHRINLGPLEHRSLIKSNRKAERLGKSPVVTFIFKYRPLSVLWALEIVPKPEVESEDKDFHVAKVDDDTDEPKPKVKSEDNKKNDTIKVDDVMEEISALETMLASLKRKCDGLTRTSKRIKTSPKPGVFAKGEVIDLT